MASPDYDAKYRKHDDAPARVISASLLSPDPASAALGPRQCEGSLAVGDEHYEPWGTPHGGVIAELATRTNGVQALAAIGDGFALHLLTSAFEFRRRWIRGEALDWSTELIAVADAAGAAPARVVSAEARMSMDGTLVGVATATFLATPTDAEGARERIAVVSGYLDSLPVASSLELPVHRAGWSPGRIEGHFPAPPASLFVALDEAMAAAANTVRGDAFGDAVAEDFLLADMDLTMAGDPGVGRPGVEYEAVIRRGRSGKDGTAAAKLLRSGEVFAYGRGRVAFLQRK